MGLCGTLILAVIFAPLPLWVLVLSSVTFWQDWFLTKLGPELPYEYDFVIVGSGSAGAVVANRLSKHHKVLIIEAGGEPLWVQKLPMACTNFLRNPAIGWDYYTVPQEFSALGVHGRTVTADRGKSLGGSSALNAMLYVRGNPKDYDNWANVTGDFSWSYEQVLPYFKKSIVYNGRHSYNEKHYGSSTYGGVHVSKHGFVGNMETFITDGLKELGVRKGDLNGPQDNFVLDRAEFTQKDGVRWDTYTGFIKPILKRANLFISRYSRAIKVKLDSQNRATGIWYVKNGVKYFAKVRKEVILSAGSIDSPKLLMLSGIGPAEELLEKKIKPRANLPVGRNLMDHLWFFLYNIVIKDRLSVSPVRDFGLTDVQNYLMNGDGVLSAPALATHHAFISSSIANGWPDIQLYFSSLSWYDGIAKDMAGFANFKLPVVESIFEPVKGKNTFVMIPSLVRPKSKGTVKLRDKNPFSPPLIDPRYLEHPDDVKVLREGIQFALKLIHNTTAFQKLGAYLPDTAVKGCEAHVINSDPYWDCYIRHIAFTNYHIVGTCKMGRRDDPTAVVDSQLRVLGTKGLRVIDASIMPEIVNGNTHAPTMMIGEKAADMVREYWSIQYLVCHRASTYYHLNTRQDSVCEYSQIT